MKRTIDPPQVNSTSGPQSYRDTAREPDIQSMFIDLKQSLPVTHTKTDKQADHFKGLKEKVDRHEEQLDQLEHCTSDMEDTQSSARE
ncbi:hypothetical protein NDU88_004058 [Pleurodeles waltl]|uniref:Uncharacterized protein n=1 Tax=Pleurodeles waltl TaxID=8319 RepID=A0AAV7V1T2_PLEWA|nr:hypothetical protein NDU88_004058 [Pleurodeles waltl]